MQQRGQILQNHQGHHVLRRGDGEADQLLILPVLLLLARFQSLLLAVDIAVRRVSGVLGQPVSPMAVVVEEIVYGLDLFRVRNGPGFVVFLVQDLPVVVLFHAVLVLGTPGSRGFVNGVHPVLCPLPGGLFHGIRPILLKLLIIGRGNHDAGHTAGQQGHGQGQNAEDRESFFHHVLLIIKSAD